MDSSETIHEVLCEAAAVQNVKAALEAADIEVQSADVSLVAANLVTLDLVGARKVMKLIDALDDHDDVDAVYSNSDVPDDVVAALSKE